MVEVLVWILVVGTHDGALDTRLLFKNEVECVRVFNGIKESNLRYVRGSCIQANILVPR